MFKFERKPMLLSEVLTYGWQLYKASFFSIWFWNLILGLIYTLPLYMGYLGMYEVDQSGKFHFSFMGTLIFITFLFISTYLSIVVLEILQGIIEGNKQSINFYFKDAVTKLFPVYLGTLSYYLLILIGFLLFIFPGLFAWILFIMFLPLMVFDNLSIFDAFAGSVRLVWRNWWQTFLVMFVPSVILYLLRHFFRFGQHLNAITLIGESLLVSVIMPYFFSAMLIQYTNLKIKLTLPKPPGTEEQPRMQS